MNRRIIKIELFGRHLVLAERTQAEVETLKQFVTLHYNLDEGDYISNIIICINVIQDSLKVNFELLKWFQIIKKLNYRRIFRTKYFLKKLSGIKIIELYQKIIEELEVVDTGKNKDDDKKFNFSVTYQHVLVSKFCNIPVTEVGTLPVTVFREILELAFNWGNFIRGFEFEFSSSVDKRLKLIREHQRLFPEMWN